MAMECKMSSTITIEELLSRTPWTPVAVSAIFMPPGKNGFFPRHRPCTMVKVGGMNKLHKAHVEFLTPPMAWRTVVL